MILKQPGLELLPDYNPAVATIVYGRNFADVSLFLRSCHVNGAERNKRIIVLVPSYGEDRLKGLGACWAHVAFIGIDPRQYQFTGMHDAWGTLDRLRSYGQFRRAFYYPDWAPDYIIPNIMEGERDW